MNTTQFLTPINPVKMAMTSSMLSSFEVLHSFVYDVIKPLFPKQPYLSRTIRDALSLSIGYKSYSDLVDSARRNTATSNDTEGNVFDFKKHEDAVWLSVCHLAEKLWTHKKHEVFTELDDLHSILTHDFFAFVILEGKSTELSLSLKNNEIIRAGRIENLYEMNSIRLFNQHTLQLYHHFIEWGYQPYLDPITFQVLNNTFMLTLDMQLADDIAKFKKAETLDTESKNALALHINAQMDKVFIRNNFFYDQQSFTPFSIKTHFYDIDGDAMFISDLYQVDKPFKN
ncbi:hypothetical protein [Providencia huaxiensis]|uniref:hypothetical protein n=1 Tax=Providencia huaxiensis TaxID=2027290 RepID=UPI002FE0694A